MKIYQGFFFCFGCFRFLLLGLLLTLIRLYQTLVSPFLPPSCNYLPSCSDYSMTAFRKHGVVGGFDLSLRRILRCHPFCQGGEDPVPDRYSLFGHKHHG